MPCKQKTKTKTKPTPERVKQTPTQKTPITHFQSDVKDLEAWLSCGAYIILTYIMMEPQGTGCGNSGQGNTLSVDDPEDLLTALQAVLKHWIYSMQNCTALEVPIPIPLYHVLSVAVSNDYNVGHTRTMVDYRMPDSWLIGHRSQQSLLRQIFDAKSGFFANRYNMKTYSGTGYLNGSSRKPMRLAYTVRTKPGAKNHAEIHSLTLAGNKPLLVKGELRGITNSGGSNAGLYQYYASCGPQLELEDSDYEIVKNTYDLLGLKKCPIKGVRDRAYRIFSLFGQGNEDSIMAVQGVSTVVRDARVINDAWVATVYTVAMTPENLLPNSIPAPPSMQAIAFTYIAGCIRIDPALFALHLDSDNVGYIKLVRHLCMNNFGDTSVPNVLSETLCIGRPTFMTVTEKLGQKQSHIHSIPYMCHETGTLSDDNVLKDYAICFDTVMAMCNSVPKKPVATEYQSLTSNASTCVDLFDYARSTLSNYCRAFASTLRTASLISMDLIGITSKVVVAVIRDDGVGKSNAFELDTSLSAFNTGPDETRSAYALGSSLPKAIQDAYRSRVAHGGTIDLGSTGESGVLNTAIVSFPPFVMGAKLVGSAYQIDIEQMLTDISSKLGRLCVTNAPPTDFYSKCIDPDIIEGLPFLRFLYFLRACVATGQSLEARDTNQRNTYNVPNHDNALLSLGYQFVISSTNDIPEHLAMSCIAAASGVETQLWSKTADHFSKLGGLGAFFKLIKGAGAVNKLVQDSTGKGIVEHASRFFHDIF